ncbi:BON domain-containing protein [Desulfoferrobacter suflitae]|uniref:BON domain-containing protein n=1 Tax=Desulfoferrobacter suflitae TaxID=2865782 RepID=UPI00216473ED|nr:BON domain-containing protein [Desulfoferrobacter suflitae]MCK8601584.1 BON domain-containing protein [Desulfoferrobacter suflitae]
MRAILAAVIVGFSVFAHLPCAGVSLEEASKSDLWLEAQLVTTYALNDSLNPFKLDVKVKDGVAELSGVVDTPVERELAVEIARGVDGIREVRDNITVHLQPQQGSQASPQRSSWYREIEDMTITAKVKTKLMWNRYTNGLNMDVSTNAGVVTLKGRVETRAVRDLAGQIAQNTEGVRRVDNQLRVPTDTAQPQSESTGAGDPVDQLSEMAERFKGTVSKSLEGAGRSAGDAWITAKVKTVLMFSRDAEGSDIQVSTKEGVVTLSGTVTSQAQASRIVQIARDVQDVKEVNSALIVEESI